MRAGFSLLERLVASLPRLGRTADPFDEPGGPFLHKFQLSRCVAILAAVVLTACGGGGGGGGGGGSGVASLPTTSASTTSANLVAVSGKASFDAIPNTPTGALNYGGVTSKPIRGAVVEVLNSASTVVATTVTDASGAYSVSVPADSQLVVRVKAQMSQGGSGPNWEVSVRDNTRSNAIYALDSAAVSSGSAPTSLRCSRQLCLEWQRLLRPARGGAIRTAGHHQYGNAKGALGRAQFGLSRVARLLERQQRPFRRRPGHRPDRND